MCPLGSERLPGTTGTCSEVDADTQAVIDGFLAISTVFGGDVVRNQDLNLVDCAKVITGVVTLPNSAPVEGELVKLMDT